MEKHEIFDKVREIKAEHEFMASAITELWGSEHSDFSTDEIILGCQCLLHKISGDLKEILDVEEKEIEAKNVQPIIEAKGK